MKTTVNADQIIKIISSQLSDVVAIYLFGSAASGEMNDESDIDLAVLPRKQLSPDLAFALKTDLAVALKRDVDLIDMLRADSVTLAQIILKGALLFQDGSKDCAIFETSSLGQYLQLNEERRGILEDIEKRGSIYGR